MYWKAWLRRLWFVFELIAQTVYEFKYKHLHLKQSPVSLERQKCYVYSAIIVLARIT